MLSVQEQIKKVPKELEDLIELPSSMQQCWNWFLELNRTRQVQMGTNSISFTEIQAFFQLHHIEHDLDELEMLKVFDSIALLHMQKQEQEEAKARESTGQKK